jgi:hypothetical protein
MASGEPLAMLVVTARPSRPNRPLTDAITNGAMLASSGRSKESRIAVGGGASLAAMLAATPKLATPNRLIRQARIQRMTTI